jgi:hypothetical protein
LKAKSSYVPARLALSFAEPELSQRLTRIYFRNQLAYCDLPFYERPGTAGALEMFDDPRGFDLGNGNVWNATDFDSAYRRAILAPLLLPISEVHPALDREEARYRTLCVVLAGQAFQRDHGRFPNTLDELVPEYLDEIPIDNYDGKPLKYRFDPDGPIVYSVYENSSDEGGSEWNPKDVSPGKLRPDDFGSQLRLPILEPLTAPKPVHP